MPRYARNQSITGYYHVVVRGIGKQILFEERADYEFYLSILRKYSREANILLHAYCLMENHVHLLVEDQENQLSLFMKKMGLVYSTYYNRKYDRTGHLFQNRFLSEPVEHEAYLWRVFRYILKNPEKAGICKAADYEWSSYRFYGKKNTIVDTSVFAEKLGSIEEYRRFISEDDAIICLENIPLQRDDDRARKLLCSELKIASGTHLQEFDRASRDEAIRRLRNIGLTVRQIERLTGISRGIIQRA